MAAALQQPRRPYVLCSRKKLETWSFGNAMRVCTPDTAAREKQNSVLASRPLAVRLCTILYFLHCALLQILCASELPAPNYFPIIY